MDILVLDENFLSTEILDSYESLIWTDRYNQYGDFEVYVSAEAKVLPFLKSSHYLWRKDSEHVMIIEDTHIESNPEDGAHAIVTGRSLESILSYFVVANRITLKGNFQTEIKRLLTENIINPSMVERKVGNFIFRDSTDEVITSLEVDVQYFGENIYDVISSLCIAKGIGFKITLEDGNFVFELYSGVDRSYDQNLRPFVVFSPEFDNLLSSDYVSNTSEMKNCAFIVGEEEKEETTEDNDGNEITTVIPQLSTNIGDAVGIKRREIFVDSGSTKRTYKDEESGEELTFTEEEYIKLLKEAGETELKLYPAEKKFNGQIDTGDQWVYGEDFYMGDIVQIRNEYGMEAKSRMVELTSSDSASGYEYYPTFESVDEDQE